MTALEGERQLFCLRCLAYADTAHFSYYMIPSHGLMNSHGCVGTPGLGLLGLFKVVIRFGL